MAVVNKFNVNNKQVTLDADIIENMSANDVSYNSSLQYDDNTVGDKLSELSQQVIYDVTVNNDGVTFTSLSELLSSENLSTLIPSTVRCGGMSIRFLNSSDNKYIQARCMAQNFTTDVTQWQGVDDGPTAASDNLVKSSGVYNYLRNYVEKSISENIINSQKCTYGCIFGRDGSIISGFSQTEYCISDYIPVNGQNITANSFNRDGYSSFVVYNQIKELRTIVNSSTYTYQQGDYYVRICFKWDNKVHNIRANYGDVLLDYVEYSPIYGYLDGVRKLENDIHITSDNLSPTIIKPKKSFNDITTTFKSVFTALQLVQKFTGKWFISSFIYKTTGSTLEIYKCLIEDNILVNKGFYETISLKSEWLAPEYGTNVYVVPYLKEIDFIPAVKFFFADNLTINDNGYIAAGQNISIKDKHAIAFGIIGAPPIEDSEITSISNYVFPVRGKTIGFLGDSITEMGYYVHSLSTLCECTCINYGIAATHIAATGTAWDEQKPPFEHRVSEMSNDLDAVVVFGGTNDFGHPNTAVFGEFTDYTDQNKYTFYAGLHRMCKQLYNKYRGKPIIIMLPIHHGYEVDTPEVIFNDDDTITEGTNPTTHKTFLDYVKAIKEVASYYSFFVIDAYAESGLNPCLETSDARYYFTDGLHPSSTGGLRLAKFMKPELEKIFNSI